jgi:GT2 family glycosyltransferase
MAVISVGSPLVVSSILNWNGGRDTIECLESVRQLDYPNYLTVVVDNGSWDDSVERIRAWAAPSPGSSSAFVEYTREAALRGGGEAQEASLDATESKKRLVLIRNEENLGFTAGNNVSIHYALKRPRAADYVFLLNNDTALEEDCLTHLVGAAEKSGAGIVGAVVLDESGRHPIFNGRTTLIRQFFHPIVNWQLAPPQNDGEFWDSDSVHGGAMMIRSDVLGSVYSLQHHYLRDELFMYLDEAEFHYHVRKLGYRSVVARDAVVHHKGAHSSGGVENPMAYYYIERNRILVASVVLPFGWKLLFHLINTPLGLARILKNATRRRRRAAGAILHGLFDGYRGVSGKWRLHDREARRDADA